MKFDQNRPAFASYRPAAVLQVEGADTLTFLQGQFTQDLKGGDAGSGRYGLWLNQKGKVLADSFAVVAGPSAAMVVSVFSPAATIRERLAAYVIADDVTVSDVTAAWQGLTVLGSVSDEWLAAARAAGVVFPGRRWRGESWECLFPLERPLAPPDAQAVSAEELERLRIEAGIPKVPQEVGPADLPNEAGLEREAISYTKGCYLGQEVMARLKTMGRVRRRLVRIRGDGPPPPTLPVSLVCGDKAVGELRSAISAGDGFVGLAMVNALAFADPTGLRLAGAPGAHLRGEELHA